MQARVAEDDIAIIVEGIFTELLGVDIQRDADPAALARFDHTFSGCVQITGAWEGAITVDCPAELARFTAKLMFGAEPESSAEVADALGEVTNMAGGNIKALLPGPSQLSLPAVAEGTNQQLSVPGASLLSEVAFECAGLPLRVTVMQRRCEAAL